jgi:hypothetical protein
MGGGGDGPSAAAAAPAPALLPLMTEETTADAAIADTHRAGLLQLRSADIWRTLRVAMAVQGDPAVQPPSAVRSWLAARYIHTRVGVDRHTAAAVLYESFSQSRVLVVRGFPGSYPPVCGSVADALVRPPPADSRVYAYNDRGSRVHFILRTPIGDTPATQQARAWWAPVNRLPDAGERPDLSGRNLYTIVSRRAQTLLHMDDADGMSTQWRGRKLWVLVDEREALAVEIRAIASDCMRDPLPRLHRFSAWEACGSFQWCILNEGDTILLPRNRLHAVACIGDEDAVASGVYCWVAGTER